VKNDKARPATIVLMEEEKINDVKQQKQELIEKLIRPGEELLTTLSAQELRQLLM